MSSFLITSYNIHKGMSPLNRFVKIHDIANALKTLNPDILCLQEVQGQHLKRAVQYNEFPEQGQHEWFGEFLEYEHSYGKNCEYDNGHHGNAVLSQHRLDSKHNVNITVNFLEQRGVLHCEIFLANSNVPITVLNAHLNLLERDRQKQYETIVHYVNHEIDPKLPLILAGDFNDWQKVSIEKLNHELQMQEAIFQQHGKLLPTFPAKLPLLSLDRIFVRNLTVKKAWVHHEPVWKNLSDHLPISAELSLIE